MEGQQGTTKSRHAAAQLFLPYISYLICCAGGFLGPVHCVILSRGRWHTHSVNQIPWIGTVEEESSPGATSPCAKISRFGWPAAASAAWKQTVASPFFFQAKPRPRNDFQHRRSHWTQLQAGIRISTGSNVTGLSCSPFLHENKCTPHRFSLTDFTLLFCHLLPDRWKMQFPLQTEEEMKSWWPLAITSCQLSSPWYEN